MFAIKYVSYNKQQGIVMLEKTLDKHDPQSRKIRSEQVGLKFKCALCKKEYHIKKKTKDNLEMCCYCEKEIKNDPEEII